ncbi:MAG TPA: major coat protein [Rhodocyclaceae bacterium]|nr:major coat protein [Rhodocyclaceae bacterium]
MKNLRNVGRKYGSKVVLGGVSGLSLLATQAQAVLPTEVTGAFTSVQTDGTSMISAGWPVLVAITGGLILMGVFKKVISKAT